MGAAEKLESMLPENEAAAEGKTPEAKIFELASEAIEFGKAGSLRSVTLVAVLEEKYDRAIKELREFMKRESDFPSFRQRTMRYLNHSIDLIYAIKAKRNFPGLSSLTRAKQQEMREKFKEHFRELQYMLKRIEKVEGDLRVEDARSTIYVLRAAVVSIFVVVLVWFLQDIGNGLGSSTLVVLEDISIQLSRYLFKLIGW